MPTTINTNVTYVMAPSRVDFSLSGGDPLLRLVYLDGGHQKGDISFSIATDGTVTDQFGVQALPADPALAATKLAFKLSLATLIQALADANKIPLP